MMTIARITATMTAPAFGSRMRCNSLTRGARKKLKKIARVIGIRTSRARTSAATITTPVARLRSASGLGVSAAGILMFMFGRRDRPCMLSDMDISHA
jgi:hypothetical protein